MTNPRPQESEAGKYYESSAYISHTAKAAGLIDYIYLIVRRFTTNWKYSLTKKYLSTNTLLDYGCGTGSFLNYCLEKGIDAYGIEPSVHARAKHARIHDSIEHLQEKQFDVITLWHVLEHVYTLDSTLDQLKSCLRNTGTIFIAVPNWQSPDAQHYKSEWAAYDVPRHIWHFSQKNMTDLLKKKGFNLHQIIPMRLDAYYVSLLSEKNIAGGNLQLSKFLKAIVIAFKSNHQAKNDLNYSSLIYVATK